MKTAMQELIEIVKKRCNFIEDDGYKEAMEDVLLIALNLLEAEKEQIMDAWNTYDSHEESPSTFEEYYQRTFKSDK